MAGVASFAVIFSAIPSASCKLVCSRLDGFNAVLHVAGQLKQSGTPPGLWYFRFAVDRLRGFFWNSGWCGEGKWTWLCSGTLQTMVQKTSFVDH